jgi:hypothetical protein
MARKTNKTFKQLRARCVYIRQDAFFSSFGHLKVLNLSQNKLLGAHWFIGRSAGLGPDTMATSALYPLSG